MAQVTSNPAMADGSSLHQEAKQQLHQYIRTYIKPLLRAGKPMELKDILLHVTLRRPKIVQQLGNRVLTDILRNIIDFGQ